MVLYDAAPQHSLEGGEPADLRNLRYRTYAKGSGSGWQQPARSRQKLPVCPRPSPAIKRTSGIRFVKQKLSGRYTSPLVLPSGYKSISLLVAACTWSLRPHFPENGALVAACVVVQAKGHSLPASQAMPAPCSRQPVQAGSPNQG